MMRPHLHAPMVVGNHLECQECGELIPFGHSDETSEEVFTEIRATEIAALADDRRRNGDGPFATLMSTDECHGFLDREYGHISRPGVDITEWDAGWLAHEIVNHEQEQGQ